MIQNQKHRVARLQSLSPLDVALPSWIKKANQGLLFEPWSQSEGNTINDTKPGRELIIWLTYK